MKRFQLVVFLGLFCLASAQKPISYRDNAKNPSVSIQGNEGYLIPGESFELNGNVQLRRINADSDAKVETLLTCAKATGLIVKLNKKTEFDQVRMTGGIEFTQKGKKGVTTATGTSGEYDLKEGGAREVTINGDVKIGFAGQEKNDATKTTKASIVDSTMSTTSRSATITFKTKLDENKKQVSEIQSATVRGPIQFNGTKLSKDADGEKRIKVSAKADQMRYTISGENGSPEVRLEGNLEFRELGGDDGAVVEGASLLILQLNDKNEIIKLKFKSGAGQQVTTTLLKMDSKGKKGGA